MNISKLTAMQVARLTFVLVPALAAGLLAGLLDRGLGVGAFIALFAFGMAGTTPPKKEASNASK